MTNYVQRAPSGARKPASPRPWRIEGSNIVSADGVTVVSRVVRLADAELIVSLVNAKK